MEDDTKLCDDAWWDEPVDCVFTRRELHTLASGLYIWEMTIHKTHPVRDGLLLLADRVSAMRG